MKRLILGIIALSQIAICNLHAENLDPIINSFKTMSTPAGSSPVATSPVDTLTFMSSDDSVTIIGNAVGKTIDLKAMGGGGGSVTAVTATSPLFSSGGTAPNLTCQAASGTQAGCLSFTDWLTFNGKQNALSFGNLTSPTTGVTVGGGTGAVIGSGTTISVQTASGSQPGLLSATDWTTFNSKQSALTFGAISSSTTGVSVGSGINSTVGPNVTVNVQTASGSQPGLLSAADWTTFNAKQAAGNYITALTGDVSASGPGSATATISSATVTGKLLTGFSSGAGTVSASDSILTAFNKVVGNIALLAPLASPSLTGTVLINASGSIVSGDVLVAEQTNNVGAQANAVFVTYNTTAGNEAIIRLLRGRGTQASPSAVLSGDNIAAVSYGGYDSALYKNTFNLVGLATENWTSTTHGTQVTFNAVPTGANNATARFNLTGDGFFTLSVKGLCATDGGCDLGAAGSQRFGTLYTKNNVNVGTSLVMNGSTSGALTQSAAATTTPYSLIWPSAQGGATTVLQNDGSGNLSWATGGGGGSGTVTSVALTAPSWLTVGGSPITTSGTLALTGTSQAANLFLASPNGSSGAMTPRAIVSADIPTLNQNTTGTAAGLSSVLAVASGGTGLATLTANSVLLGNGTSNPTFVAPSTSGNLLTSNGSTWQSTAPTFASSSLANGKIYIGSSGGVATAQTITGDIAISNAGSALVVDVGGITAAAVASGALLANAATNANTASTIVKRSASGNVQLNNINVSTISVNNAGTITMDGSSTANQILTAGSLGAQTYILPDATTIIVGRKFHFTNVDTNGWDQLIKDTSGTQIVDIQKGGVVDITLQANATSAGVWGIDSYVPGFVTWDSSSLDLGTSANITSGGDTGASLELNDGISLNNDETNNVIRIVADDGNKWQLIDNDGNLSAEIQQRVLWDQSTSGGVTWGTGQKILSNDSGYPIYDWNQNWIYSSTSNGTLLAAFGYNTGVDTSVTHLASIEEGANLLTVAPSTGAGTGGTVSLGASSTDLSGTIALTTGTLPSASAKIFTITLAHPYPAAPQSVTLFQQNPAAAPAMISIYYNRSTSTSTTVDIYSTAVALSAATSFAWGYSIVE